jgi:hypothetical protein
MAVSDVKLTKFKKQGKGIFIFFSVAIPLLVVGIGFVYQSKQPVVLAKGLRNLLDSAQLEETSEKLVVRFEKSDIEPRDVVQAGFLPNIGEKIDDELEWNFFPKQPGKEIVFQIVFEEGRLKRLVFPIQTLSLMEKKDCRALVEVLERSTISFTDRRTKISRRDRDAAKDLTSRIAPIGTWVKVFGDPVSSNRIASKIELYFEVGSGSGPIKILAYFLPINGKFVGLAIEVRGRTFVLSSDDIYVKF